jgi:hypothetical protein
VSVELLVRLFMLAAITKILALYNLLYVGFLLQRFGSRSADNKDRVNPLRDHKTFDRQFTFYNISRDVVKLCLFRTAITSMRDRAVLICPSTWRKAA